MAAGIIRRFTGGILGGKGKTDLVNGKKSGVSSEIQKLVKDKTDPMKIWQNSKGRLQLIGQHGEKIVKTAEKQAYKEAKVSEDPVKLSIAKVRKQIMNGVKGL